MEISARPKIHFRIGRRNKRNIVPCLRHPLGINTIGLYNDRCTQLIPVCQTTARDCTRTALRNTVLFD